MRAWKKALECLPKENLTPTQQTMKTQFMQGLQKAKVARKKIETGMEMIGPETIGQRPWEVATALRSQKLAARRPSCVRLRHLFRTHDLTHSSPLDIHDGLCL